MTYDDALAKAKRARELGDPDLELGFLKKAKELKASQPIEEAPTPEAAPPATGFHPWDSAVNFYDTEMNKVRHPELREDNGPLVTDKNAGLLTQSLEASKNFIGRTPAALKAGLATQLHLAKEGYRGLAKGTVGVAQALDDLSGTTEMRRLRGSDFKYQDIYDNIADWKKEEPVPYFDAIANFGGEMLPNTLATAGLMNPVSKLFMKTAAAEASPVYSKVASAIKQGLVSGGVSGGLMPVQEGDAGRGYNIAGGTVLGGTMGALQGTGSVALKYAKDLANLTGLPLLANKAASATKLVADDIIGRLGINRARATAERAANVPVEHPVLLTKGSTAGNTGDLELAAYERMSRNSYPAQWTERDEAANALRRGYLASHEEPQQVIDILKALRNETTLPMKESLYSIPSLTELDTTMPWTAKMLTESGRAGSGSSLVIDDALAALKTSPSMTTPIQKLIGVNRDLAHALNPATRPAKAFKSASLEDTKAFSNEALTDMNIQLDEATGGRWNEYLTAHKSLSKVPNELEAIQEINKKLGASATPAPAGTPSVEADDIRSILEKEAERHFGTRLTPEKQDMYNMVADDAAREVTYRRLPTSGTKKDIGEVHKTIQNLEGPLIGFRSPVLGAARGLSSTVAKKTDEAFNLMMQDPAEYSRAISAALRERLPVGMMSRIQDAKRVAAATAAAVNLTSRD
jgi:hypothetical protein